MQANNLKKSQTIKIGQMLKIPAAEPQTARTSQQSPGTSGGTKSPKQHLVKKGQTLSVIAKIHNTSVKAITKANAITDPRQIRPGQKLIIPEG